MSNLTAIPSPLAEVLPAQVRRGLYVTFAIVGIVLGAIQVGYAAVPDINTPTWLIVALAVYASLGTPFGALALANVPSVTIVPGEVLASTDELLDVSADDAVYGDVYSDEFTYLDGGSIR